jgi:GNAT superfamily N-acetyltransferase
LAEQNDIQISTDKSLLDIEAIYNFLSGSYWAKGRSLEVMKKSIQNSLCFGVYFNKKQVGFARVVTDYAIFAYIADVFILEAHRGKGFSKKLIKSIIGYPELKRIKRWMLATKDAHDLYNKFGFQPLKNPERFMELVTSTAESPIIHDHKNRA